MFESAGPQALERNATVVEQTQSQRPPASIRSKTFKNRLLIIQPTYRVRPDGPLYKTKGRSLMGLTLPYLASLTPPEWDITLLDEQIEDIDFDAAVDIVAITAWTINSPRAYEISARFRDRGVPVIMGGPHTFFHAEEAAAECDAVGVGEAEFIWVQMLEDAAAGRLQRIYRANQSHDLIGLPPPRYDIANLSGIKRFRTYSVQNSRGCPFKCEFCSERFYVGTQYRYRPAEEVVEEIRATGAKNIFFADSMFAGKKQMAMKLMEQLIPLNIRWSTLWTTYLCSDNEFMDLAARSGLLHVNMGMESVDQETLGNMNKNFNKVENYDEILGGLHRRGISYSLNFVFGFEGEKPTIFDSTLRFLDDHKVPVAYFYILNPDKGTPLYDRMRREGKVIDEKDMYRGPGIRCNITPSYCSPQEMEQNVRGMYERFYTMPNMARRLPLPVTKANIASWILNVSQRRMAKATRDSKNFDWV